VTLPCSYSRAAREKGGGKEGPVLTQIAQEVSWRQEVLQITPSRSRHPHTHVAHPLLQAVTLELHYTLYNLLTSLSHIYYEKIIVAIKSALFKYDGILPVLILPYLYS